MANADELYEIAALVSAFDTFVEECMEAQHVNVEWTAFQPWVVTTKDGEVNLGTISIDEGPKAVFEGESD